MLNQFIIYLFSPLEEFETFTLTFPNMIFEFFDLDEKTVYLQDHVQHTFHSLPITKDEVKVYSRFFTKHWNDDAYTPYRSLFVNPYSSFGTPSAEDLACFALLIAAWGALLSSNKLNYKVILFSLIGSILSLIDVTIAQWRTTTTKITYNYGTFLGKKFDEELYYREKFGIPGGPEDDLNWLNSSIQKLRTINTPESDISLVQLLDCLAYESKRQLNNQIWAWNTFTEIAEHQIISFVFLKDIFAFICIALFLASNAEGDVADFDLIPEDLDEILNESFYKFSLGLFASTLNIKDKAVRDNQDLFLMVNGIALFILCSNMIGMIPYSLTITSSLMNTFYVALAVFITIISKMIKDKGVSHLLSLFLPHGCPFALVWLLIPIELISYSFRLVSLSVRLFANMMAGHTLLKVISGFGWSLMLLGDYYVLLYYIPWIVLHLLVVLELGVAVIQTYVFVVLTYMYLRDIFVGH